MGLLWAAVSGVGFGLFQSVNARATREFADPYLSTFLQLLAATVVIVAVCAAGGELARLDDASGRALASFAVAGALHFCLSWTLINLSHKRIGAARTSPLLATTPLFGVVVAVVVLDDVPAPVAFVGIVVVVLGAYVIAGASRDIRWWEALPALGTAFVWALSPVFAVKGLEELDSPLLGTAIGLVFSLALYALLLLFRRRAAPFATVPRRGLLLKLVAGVLVGLATWWRWAALEVAPVGVVLALSQLSVPTVLLVAPIVGGRSIERVTARLLVGASLILGGSLTLIAVQ